jgi:hypothetical protein
VKKVLANRRHDIIIFSQIPAFSQRYFRSLICKPFLAQMRLTLLLKHSQWRLTFPKMLKPRVSLHQDAVLLGWPKHRSPPVSTHFGLYIKWFQALTTFLPYTLLINIEIYQLLVA